MIKIGLIGLSYKHEISAVLDIFGNSKGSEYNSIYQLSLITSHSSWSCLIEHELTSVTFLDCDKLKFGDWKYLRQKNITKVNDNNSSNIFTLSNDELTDCAVVFSRYVPSQSLETIMRKRKFLNTGLNLCIQIIKNSEIDYLFFRSLPYDIFSLLLSFAAIRLNKLCFTPGWLGFSCLYYISPFTKSLEKDALVLRKMSDYNKLTSKVSDIVISDVVNFLNSRNRKNDCFNVFYMNSNYRFENESLVLPDEITFYTLFFYFFSNILPKKAFVLKINRKLDFFYIRIWEYFGKTYRYVFLYLLKSMKKVNVFQFNQKTVNGKYILLALHFQPETSTCPSSYTSPLFSTLLKQLSVKFYDYDLRVREHPSILSFQRGWCFWRFRDSKFFEAITTLDNVYYELPSSFNDLTALIEDSEFVISVTGTICYEAILLGIPCVHLGNSSCKGLPGLVVYDSVNSINVEYIMSLKNTLMLTSFSEKTRLWFDFLCGLFPLKSLFGSDSDHLSNYQDATEKFLKHMLDTIKNIDLSTN